MRTPLDGCPYPPPCSHYGGRVRCTAPATHWYLDSEGALNPGGYTCEAHGRATVAEYAARLGETWTLRPIAAA